MPATGANCPRGHQVAAGFGVVLKVEGDVSVIVGYMSGGDR